MGMLTLEDFCTELAAKFGERGVTTPRMIVWINLACTEVAGAIAFHGLYDEDDDYTVAGQELLDLPDEVLFIKRITLPDEKKKLRKITENAFSMLDATQTGMPEVWLRKGDSIYLRPIPDAKYNLHIEYYKEPTKLAAETDVTIFPAQWDSAVLLMAIHFGCLFYEMFDAADRYQVRAMTALRSRKTDIELDNEDRQGGVNIAISESDLTDQETL